MGIEVTHPEPMKRTRRLGLVSLSVILALGLAPKLSFADEAQANTDPVNVVMTETEDTEDDGLTDNINQAPEVSDNAQDSNEETTEPLPDESTLPDSPESADLPDDETDPGNTIINNEEAPEVTPDESPSEPETDAATAPSEDLETILDSENDESPESDPEEESEEALAMDDLFSDEASLAANQSATDAINRIKSSGYYRPGNNCPSGKNVGWLVNGSTNCQNECFALIRGFQGQLLGGTFIGGVMTYGYKATNTGSYNCVGTLIDTPKAQPSLDSVKNLLLKAYPGDVIQFKGGPSSYAGTAQHTAMVEAVDNNGIRVYQHGNSAHINSTYYNWSTFYNSYLDFDRYTNYNKGISLYHHKDYERIFPPIHIHNYQANGYTFVDYAGHNKNTRCSCGATQSTYEGHTWKTTTDDKQRVCSVCGHEAVGFNGSVTTITDGEYWIESAGNNAFRIDVSGGAVNTEKTNVQLWSKHDVAAQKITIKKSPYADGTYLLQVGTAPMLIGAAEDYNLKAGVNVCLRKNSVSNESNRWFVEVNSDGTYSFRNKCNNLYMDIWGAVFADSTNVQCWGGNQGSAQKFNLVAVPAPEPEPKPEPDPKLVTPVEPSTPNNPSTPTTPDKPSTPTTPENPSTPSQPTKPSTPTPSPSTKSGSWQESNGSWWYCYSDGSYPKSQWLKIGPTWYHFDKSGWMQTGWYSEGKHWYYLGTNGAMKTGWYGVGPTWYYSNASGVMQTGWIKDGNNWYYLGSDGAMRTGWFAVNSTWYYSNASGVMQANKWIGNYYVTSSGAMATDTWIGKYHVNSNGVWDDER